MASSLAHELNQPLSAIANYCAGCIKRMQSGNYQFDDLLAAMQKAGEQAERAGKIIRRMRTWSKRAIPTGSRCRSPNCRRDARLRRHRGAAHRHGHRRRHSENLPRIVVDRIMIEQLLLNLLKNGIEAMESTPFVRRRLSVSARQLDDRLVEVASPIRATA